MLELILNKFLINNYNLDKAARLRHGVIPNLQTELEELQESKEQLGP